jgi:hypothetical protein
VPRHFRGWKFLPWKGGTQVGWARAVTRHCVGGGRTMDTDAVAAEAAEGDRYE